MTLFLSEEQVLVIHRAVIDAHGGLHGIRDMALLQSAVSQPRATMFGEFLHPTIFDKAGAYLYHIARNHAFLDGNKRTATEACDVFLRVNGYIFEGDLAAFEDMVVRVAQGAISKQQIAEFLETSYAHVSGKP